MSIDLSSYSSVRTGLFVSLTIDYYRVGPNDSFTQQVLRFSDYNQDITVAGDVYTGLGQLIGITTSTSELRSSGSSLTITVTGIPNASISELVNSRIKGSPVTVYRVFFNPTTGQALNIAGNPTGRFFGIVNNFTLQEEFDYQTRTSKNTIALICASNISQLSNKIQGRRTNPFDEKSYFPADLAMDRVPNIKDANYNFGAAK